MRTNYIVSLLGLVFLNVACYNQRPQMHCPTHTEAPDPQVKDEIEWKETGRGLHVSFGHKDVKYAKGKVPTLSVTKDQAINVWRGERVSLQAILWSAYDVEQVECQWDDMVTADDDTIPAESIQTRFVRYVMSDAGFVSNDKNGPEQQDSCLVADLLDELSCIHMKAGTVRPVWITVDIPHDAKPGVYATSLKVYSKANPPQELRLKVNVLQQQLPASAHWTFQTHLYINPYAVAQWHQLKPWSQDHFMALEPYQELLHLAGQKSIATNLFCHEEYATAQDAFDAQLIKWTKTKSGSFKGDYTIFNQWIKQSKHKLKCSQIDCYTLFPAKSNSIVYFDERLQKLIYKSIDISADQQLIKGCLSSLNRHLQANNWFDQAVMVIGEGEIEEVGAIKQLIRSVNTKLKLELVADKWSSGLMDDVYAADVASQFSNLKEWFKVRHQQGQESLYHVTAHNEYPNVFMHSPSAEAAWFGWYMAAQEMDGIHIMNFNNWTSDALIDARLPASSSGSSYLIYPHARSSIRFERLIEGIQDFEKIKILREHYSSQDSSKHKLEQIDGVLSDFVINRLPRESASQMVQNGQELLYQLSPQ